MTYSFFAIPHLMSPTVNIWLLNITGLLLVFAAIKLVVSKGLLETIIVMSVFSLLISLCYLLMDAPDVAMTEAALNSCLSSCILLSFSRLINLKANNNSIQRHRVIIATPLCFLFIAIMSWASFELPPYGSLNSPLQDNLSRYYTENTRQEIGIPSLVAAILASYRGFDTLNETAVIFIAGMAVLLIFSPQQKHA